MLTCTVSVGYLKVVMVVMARVVNLVQLVFQVEMVLQDQMVLMVLRSRESQDLQVRPSMWSVLFSAACVWLQCDLF